MPAYVTPGAYYETADRGVPAAGPVRTDVAAFVGVAAAGPLHRPTAVESFAQFRSAFGGFLPDASLAYIVKAFLDNGGRRCYVVRVAAAVASTGAKSGAAQPADGSTSVVESTAGFVAGSVVTVVRDELRQSDHLLREVDAVAGELRWERPLEPWLLGAPLRFDTGPAAASGTLLDGAGVTTLTVRATSAGAWGNALQVVLTRSSLSATPTAGTAQPPGGNSTLVASVTGFLVGSLVKIHQDGSPAASVCHRVVTAVDAGRSLLTWDAPLPAAIDPTRPFSLETLEFALAVRQDGASRELFPGLSLVPGHPRYVETAVNGVSTLIEVSDAQSATPTPDNLPDPAASNLTRGVLTLRAGRDGIAGLRPSDFTGDPGDDAPRGLATVLTVDEPAMVAVPDVHIRPAPPVLTSPTEPPASDPCSLCPPPPADAPPPPPPPLQEVAPEFSADEVARVQQALVEHCELRRDRIALLDPPRFSRGKEAVDVGEVQAWRRRFDSSYAALYFPWLRVYDPRPARPGELRDIPPSGHAAGTFARVDLETGVHRAPANVELRWVQDVAAAVDAEAQGVLNPAGVNVIRSFAGRGVRVYGARTVSSEPAWRFVNVRRLMMWVEKSVERSLQWAVFEPHAAGLRHAVAGTITGFLEAAFEAGAFAGATESEAFYVRCDATNNPPDSAAVGRLVAEVGVAPALPAEFVVFRVGRTDDALEVGE